MKRVHREDHLEGRGSDANVLPCKNGPMTDLSNVV